MPSPAIQIPLRPTQHVEQILVTSILNGTYPIGSPLPAERTLATQIGVTRPTLRETLQRLAKEGWVEIRHGKPTLVNDYWQKGGLSLLSTVAKYGKHLPKGTIRHLLEVRLTLLPDIANRAATFHPQPLIRYLEKANRLQSAPVPFAAFDWELQMLMAHRSDNPIYALILNDFAPLFKNMALRYFKDAGARSASLKYYRALARAISRDGQGVADVVRKAMKESIAIWQATRSG